MFTDFYIMVIRENPMVRKPKIAEICSLNDFSAKISCTKAQGR